jgi:hypothetical protein
MKKRSFLNRVSIFTVCLSLGLVFSCTKDDERVTSSDTADVVSESLTDSYYEDIDDMSLAAVNADGSPAGGRIASDDRFCTAIQFDGTASSGVIIIDFGVGCTDPRGNVRTGIIRLDYSNGPAGTTGFQVITSFDGYTINGIKLEGTRTIERLASDNADIVRHKITLADGKATWPDNSVATRGSSFIREFNLNDLTVKLNGEAEGMNRRGKSYTMNIMETLLYKGECVLTDGIYMAVSGVKTFTSGGRALTIDYGDGTCDRMVTVRIDNAATSFAVGG